MITVTGGPIVVPQQNAAVILDAALIKYEHRIIDPQDEIAVTVTLYDSDDNALNSFNLYFKQTAFAITPATVSNTFDAFTDKLDLILKAAFEADNGSATFTIV